MRIEGRQSVDAPVDTVWAAIQDPEMLRSCIPGCRRLDLIAPAEYEAEVEISVAGIKGRYAGRVIVRDQVEPSSLTLEVHGKGDMGVVDGNVQVRLESRGERLTDLVYDGTADIGGRVARVGQRVLGTVSKVLIGQFFRCMSSRITR